MNDIISLLFALGILSFGVYAFRVISKLKKSDQLLSKIDATSFQNNYPAKQVDIKKFMRFLQREHTFRNRPEITEKTSIIRTFFSPDPVDIIIRQREGFIELEVKFPPYFDIGKRAEVALEVSEYLKKCISPKEPFFTKLKRIFN